MWAITSENKPKGSFRYRSSLFRYALAYIIITFVVLLFLNYYTSKANQAVFYNSKESTMTERCNLLGEEISQLALINETKIAQAIEGVSTVRMDRIVVTDASGMVLYDSNGPVRETVYTDLPEISRALTGLDVFSWRLQSGVMISQAAVPMIAYGSKIGAVYIMEQDPQQGALLHSLQVNTLWITVLLEIALVLFSFIFARAYAARVRKLMLSMRIIRQGDYSHRLAMGGRDELTVLGDEFNDLTERLQTSENKRRQFVSDASHELKTPLASIKLLSDSILQNDMDLETVKEFVGDIGNEADRLTRMSEKLLTLTQTETPPEDAYEITLIAPTVERVTRMLSQLAQQKNIAISLSLSQDSPILILEDDLYQIVFNLVENGIKYNRPDGRLHIDLQRQDDSVVLSVRDTGVGIPPDALGHVFERFYRVDRARSRQTGGSGLGLAIVKAIVERNNGQIRVESVPDEGTVFFVHFPIFDAELSEPSEDGPSD